MKKFLLTAIVFFSVNAVLMAQTQKKEAAQPAPLQKKASVKKTKDQAKAHNAKMVTLKKAEAAKTAGAESTKPSSQSTGKKN
jgi:Ni/Co efflux regulator RcnB